MKNFIIRAATGLFFILIIIGCIIYSPVSFAIVFTILTALCIWEFAKVVNKKESVEINAGVNALGGAYLFLAFLAFCTNIAGSYIFIPYLIIILYLFISELYLKRENPINNWAYSFFSQIYVALPFSLLNVLAFQQNGIAGGVSYNFILPLAVFIFLWLSDTGAYCVGSLIGKHRLFERISPKKSWEGSIGGAVVAIASSFALAHFFPFMTTLQWVGLAAIVVVFGTWGDLVESLLKRQLRIKDSGQILPGHGGMLDRFDSALLAIPAAVIYIYALSYLS